MHPVSGSSISKMGGIDNKSNTRLGSKFAEALAQTTANSTNNISSNSMSYSAAALNEDLQRKSIKHRSNKFSLGDKILRGLTNVGITENKAWNLAKEMYTSNAKFSAENILLIELAVANSVISIDMATKLLGKLASTVDSMLRLQ